MRPSWPRTVETIRCLTLKFAAEWFPSMRHSFGPSGGCGGRCCCVLLGLGGRLGLPGRRSLGQQHGRRGQGDGGHKRKETLHSKILRIEINLWLKTHTTATAVQDIPEDPSSVYRSFRCNGSVFLRRRRLIISTNTEKPIAK